MISNRMTRAELIQWLGNTIRRETEKPFDKIDYAFVDECGCLLDELMGKSTTMSEEEIAEKIAELRPIESSAVRKNTGLIQRKFWKIAIIAAVILGMGITVIAVPELRCIIHDVLQLDIGKSVDDEGITFINAGKGTTYANMDALIVAENLDILSFEDPTGVLKVHTIKYIDDVSKTIIIFNDSSISFEIRYNINMINDEIKNKSAHLSAPYASVYLLQVEKAAEIEYLAYFIYSNDTYIIKCTSKDILNSVLDSLSSTTSE